MIYYKCIFVSIDTNYPKKKAFIYSIKEDSPNPFGSLNSLTHRLSYTIHIMHQIEKKNKLNANMKINAFKNNDKIKI